MKKTHNYKNPSKARPDLAKVEAQVTKGKKYYDEHYNEGCQTLLLS